jgi:hypothetical protein
MMTYRPTNDLLLETVILTDAGEKHLVLGLQNEILRSRLAQDDMFSNRSFVHPMAYGASQVLGRPQESSPVPANGSGKPLGALSCSVLWSSLQDQREVHCCTLIQLHHTKREWPA